MIDINLLPYEQRVSKKLVWFVSLFGVISLASLITIGIYSYHLNNELQSIQKQEAVWKARADKKVDLNEPDVSTKPTPSDAVQEILSHRLAVFTTWALMIKQLPENGIITNIEYDASGQMTVTCNLSHFADIRPFMDKLRGQQHFAQVVTTQMSQLDQTAIELNDTQRNAYQITFTMRTEASLPINQKKD